MPSARHRRERPHVVDAMAQETGTLVRWLKGEGDAVQEGEPIAEIQTDKATEELQARASGTLAVEGRIAIAPTRPFDLTVEGTLDLAARHLSHRPRALLVVQ